MFSVILDMDGTLLDTQRICIPAWDYAGELQGFESVGACVPAVCGMNERGWSAYLEARYPTMDLPAFKKAMRDYIIENGVVRFKEGAEALLAFLKDHHIKVALASGSSHASIAHHLAEVGAADVFDAIAGGHDVSNGKPAPDIFLLAAEKLGVPPETCYVFEDSANGVRAAHAAGMKCFGVPDIATFDADVQRLMTAQLRCLSDAIPLFEAELTKENTI